MSKSLVHNPMTTFRGKELMVLNFCSS